MRTDNNEKKQLVFYFKGKSCSRRKLLPSPQHTVERRIHEYIIQNRDKVVGYSGTASPRGPPPQKTNKSRIQSSGIDAVKNNDQPSSRSQEVERGEIRERQGMRKRIAFPRATELQTDRGPTSSSHRPTEWFIKAEESAAGRRRL